MSIKPSCDDVALVSMLNVQTYGSQALADERNVIFAIVFEPLAICITAHRAFEEAIQWTELIHWALDDIFHAKLLANVSPN
ncbi:hypothetical protein WT41_01580 [Burkholderia territorii]|nr:hypothetical protein WT41_01580 [Burkholderia territorii]